MRPFQKRLEPFMPGLTEFVNMGEAASVTNYRTNRNRDNIDESVPFILPFRICQVCKMVWDRRTLIFFHVCIH